MVRGVETACPLHHNLDNKIMNHFLKFAATWSILCVVQLDSCLPQPASVDYLGANKTLVPGKAWPCGMPDGIPVPERGAPVFEAAIKLDHVYDVGRTPYGQRKVYVIQSGTVTGDKLNGAIMAGGLDFELSFSNGAMEIEQVFIVKTTDGKYIYVRSAGTAADRSDVRMVPDFEAPNGSNFAWLNSGKYAGRRVVDAAAGTMKLSVFEISGVATETNSANLFQVTKPPGLPAQPWDYRRVASGEKRGDPLITENVTLGQSQSVGATKNGGRNIIPITGGTLSGKITGKILFGGADYQKLGNTPTLDARYLWQTEEGDVIIVRNAGPISSLVPTFEAPMDGKYSWLNKGTYLSSSPGMGAGGVSLNFYVSGN
jgi:hypothetical protein